MVHCQSKYRVEKSWTSRTNTAPGWRPDPNVTVTPGGRHHVSIGPARSKRVEGRIILEGALAETTIGAEVGLYVKDENPSGHRYLFRRTAPVARDGTFEIDAYADLPQRLVFVDGGFYFQQSRFEPRSGVEIRIPLAAVDLSSPAGHRFAELKPLDQASTMRSSFHADLGDGSQPVRLTAVPGKYRLRLNAGAPDAFRDLELSAGEIRTLQIQAEPQGAEASGLGRR